MGTEATHVTRMLNRWRMIIMIIRGAMSQRDIKRTPDAGRSQIRPINSRKTMRPFLLKQKMKVKHKTKKQIMKFLTHTTGDSRRQQKGISLGMPVLLVICITQQRRYNEQRNRKQKVRSARLSQCVALT